MICHEHGTHGIVVELDIHYGEATWVQGEDSSETVGEEVLKDIVPKLLQTVVANPGSRSTKTRPTLELSEARRDHPLCALSDGDPPESKRRPHRAPSVY